MQWKEGFIDRGYGERLTQLFLFMFKRLTSKRTCSAPKGSSLDCTVVVYLCLREARQKTEGQVMKRQREKIHNNYKMRLV